ncbi:MAG TPA: FAD:protein FMN transferase, partial [Polyangia bacterium]
MVRVHCPEPRPRRSPGGWRRAALLLPVAALAACSSPRPPSAAEPQVVRATRSLFGATVAVSVTARDRGEVERAQRSVLAALGEARRVEDAMTAGGPLLAQVGRTAGRPVDLPEDLFRLTTHALRLAELTGGAYDPTAGPVRELYANGRAPAAAALHARLALVGAKQVRLTPRPPGFVGTVALGRAGMTLEVDPLWRPYAVDRAAAHLAQSGIADFLVDAGTAAAARGAAPRGAWRVGVADASREGAWAARLFLKDAGMAVAARPACPAAAACPPPVDPRTGVPAAGLD